MTGPTTQDEAIASVKSVRGARIITLADNDGALIYAASGLAAEASTPDARYRHEFNLARQFDPDFDRLARITRSAIQLRTR